MRFVQNFHQTKSSWDRPDFGISDISIYSEIGENIRKFLIFLLIVFYDYFLL